MENTVCLSYSMRIVISLCALFLTSISINIMAQVRPLAVNYVVASEKLHTSGQPDTGQLSSIASLGFDLVSN